MNSCLAALLRARGQEFEPIRTALPIVETPGPEPNRPPPASGQPAR